MYPLIRYARQLTELRRLPRIGPFDMHETMIRVWPIDIDPWGELNNGRTLTLYDLGRVPLVVRNGITDVLRERGWGFTVAASVTRYRRRVRVFEKLVLRSRFIGWDARFLYFEQSMWRPDGECTSHILIRSAIVGAGRAGLVPAPQFAKAFGLAETSPPLPDWVQAWIAAEDSRPWPPMRD